MQKISHPIATASFILLLGLVAALIFFEGLIKEFWDSRHDPLAVLNRQLQASELQPENKEKLIESFVNTVSMTASIPENQFNKLALQLKNKELSLAEKEKLISQKEAEFRLRNTSLNLTERMLVVGMVLVLGLVILNFYFDYKRSLQIFRRSNI